MTGDVNADADVIVPLRSRRRRRALAAQKFHHAVPTVGLIAGGVESLTAGAEGFELWLAIAGIVTSVLLIVSMARSLRGIRRPPDGTAPAASHHHGVDWADIWAAGMLLAEAGEKFRLRKHVAQPILLTAAITLTFGLFHGRLTPWIERRRSLRLTGDALSAGGRMLFTTFTARWAEIARIDLTDRDAVVQTHDGRRRRFNFNDLENAADVRAALLLARTRLAP